MQTPEEHPNGRQQLIVFRRVPTASDHMTLCCALTTLGSLHFSMDEGTKRNSQVRISKST